MDCRKRTHRGVLELSMLFTQLVSDRGSLQNQVLWKKRHAFETAGRVVRMRFISTW